MTGKLQIKNTLLLIIANKERKLIGKNFTLSLLKRAERERQQH